jgi:site-specific recombinase XerD
VRAESGRPFFLAADDSDDSLALGAGHHLFSRWPRDRSPLAGADRITAAIETSRQIIQADRSPGTLDKYARDFALFAYWMIAHRPTNTILPTHPALVGIYIGDLRNQGLSKRRIIGRIAAIQYANAVLGHELELTRGPIYREIRGLRRLVDRDRQLRPALLLEEAGMMLAELGAPATLFDCRERALFALGWTSALRRSNVAALRVRDVIIKFDSLKDNRYLDVYVAASKTDQEREGRYLQVPEMPGHHPLCAVRAIEDWIERAGIAGEPDSPLFRSFTLARAARERQMKSTGITGQDVSRAVKRIAAATGRDPSKFAAHALRRGFATSADEKGIRRALIRQHGGWKSDAMLDIYTRVNSARDNAIAEMVGRKKGR